MRNNLFKKILVVGMILLFIGTSIPISNATIEESSENAEIADEEFEKYIELFDEETQKIINQALFERIGVFLIISSGLGYSGIFPILPKSSDNFSLFFIANIHYTKAISWTRIRKIGAGLVDSAYGSHNLFFVGIGFMRYVPRFFLPDTINFVGICLTKPIIKKS